MSQPCQGFSRSEVNLIRILQKINLDTLEGLEL